MYLFRIFLFQLYLEVKRKILVPLLIGFICLQLVVFLLARAVENNYESALIFAKWTQAINTLLVFIAFSIFFAFSWENIREKKLAQVELSKPVSRSAYFMVRFLSFSCLLFIISVGSGIVSQLLGLFIYGKTYSDIKNLNHAIKISDYSAKNIRVEGIRTFGSKLRENILIADLLNSGELELIYNIYPEYTGLNEYYLYFKAQVSSDKNYVYMRFKVYRDFDEDNSVQFDEKIISMYPHFIKLPAEYFQKPAKISVKIERLDKNVYVRFDQFEPQIIYSKEGTGKTILKEVVYQALISWQSSTPAYLLAAFTSPPTAIIGSFIYWLWANSKDLLKAGRKSVQSKIIWEREEHTHHKEESLEFPQWMEKLSLIISTAVDKLIPDFKNYSFTPLLEKKITITDTDFIVTIFNSLIVNLVVVFVVSLLFKSYEFPV